MRKISKFFLLRSEKNLFFRLFRFEAKSWKSEAKQKRTKRKQQSETKWEPKNCENKSQKGQNLIVLKLLLKCMGSTIVQFVLKHHPE
jgi:hypothetical protein